MTERDKIELQLISFVSKVIVKARSSIKNQAANCPADCVPSHHHERRCYTGCVKEGVVPTMARWPRLTAHVICESLGYATPSRAARIINDATEGRENWCEWVYACYQGNARAVIENTVTRRHTHRGYMSDYFRALTIVASTLNGQEEPKFASWF
jgi:hypothetical protein